jgi:hypothetical protein
LRAYQTLSDDDLNSITRNYGLRAKVRELRDFQASETRYEVQIPTIDQYLENSFDTLFQGKSSWTYEDLYTFFSTVRRHVHSESKNTNNNFDAFLRRIEEWETMTKRREDNVRKDAVVGFDVSSATLIEILNKTRL